MPLATAELHWRARNRLFGRRQRTALPRLYPRGQFALPRVELVADPKDRQIVMFSKVIHFPPKLLAFDPEQEFGNAITATNQIRILGDFVVQGHAVRP